MMRRGDLEQYPVDWVLREAARDRVSGGIELHTARPAVVYLKDGQVYLVLRDGEQVDPIDEALDDRSYQAAVVATEIRQRAHAVEVLAEVLEVGDEGYYFHHPLNDHPLEGSWGWAPEDLLAAVEAARTEPEPEPEPGPDGAAAEAAPADGGDDAEGGDGEVPAAEERTPGPSADDRITLATAPPERTLDLDAWRALRALVTPTLQTELVGRLGGGATAAALVDDLCAQGVLVREPAGDGAQGAGGEPDAEGNDDEADDRAPEGAARDGDEVAEGTDRDGDDEVDDDEPEAAAAGGRSGRRRRWGR